MKGAEAKKDIGINQKFFQGFFERRIFKKVKLAVLRRKGQYRED